MAARNVMNKELTGGVRRGECATQKERHATAKRARREGLRERALPQTVEFLWNCLAHRRVLGIVGEFSSSGTTVLKSEGSEGETSEIREDVFEDGERGSTHTTMAGMIDTKLKEAVSDS